MDILDAAMKEVDGVIHLVALWLLQCYEFPRAAFDVNIRGTFNVFEACVTNNIKWVTQPPAIRISSWKNSERG